ncbi:MAG: hypothetical protein ACRCVD_02700, partial [Halioglobus sp.]
QPPCRFTITCDPSAIVAKRRYAVRVVLMKEACLLFTTGQLAPVHKHRRTAAPGSRCLIPCAYNRAPSLVAPGMYSASAITITT